MSREGGSSRADWDTSYFDDPKVKALWRIVEPDVATMCECLAVHEATVMATWREGRRVTADDALPLWFPAPVPERLVELLARVGLLDSSRKVPLKSFRGWISPALARISAASEAGRKAGLASAAARIARTAVERPLNENGKPFNPTNQPTNQPSSRGRAGARGAARPARITGDDLPAIGSLKAAVAAHGFDPDGMAS